MGYEKNKKNMRIKDAMPKSMSQRKRERENNGYFDASQKERKQWVQRHPPERIKDSPYFQRFQKESYDIRAHKNTKKCSTHLHNLDQSV
jgi:hypothetical protein